MDDPLGLPNVLDDRAVPHRKVASGPTRHVRVVGHDHQRGVPVLTDPLEEREDRLRVPRVELAGRLVREQETGSVGERARDGDPLLLASRQLVGERPFPPLRPTSSRSWDARRVRSPRGTRSARIGSSTFSRAVKVGRR
jgi:hypothetical protein